MANYKEIVTKTVIGKAKKTSKNSVVITPEQSPSTVLGCWVINHSFKGVSEKGLVKLNGSFDVNVWYSYDNDHKTAVVTKTFDYLDEMKPTIKNNSKLSDESEIIVHSLKQPTVSDVSLQNGQVKLVVEKEMGVEVVGEAKIKVTIEDDEDDYEELVDESEIDQVIDEIDEEYLK